MDFLKNNISPSDKIFNEILTILDAYEVSSKEKIDSTILKKKEEIKKFSKLNQLKLELENSKYYEIHYFLNIFKNNANRLLRKINDDYE